jgi:hypothetical protein
VSTAKSWSEGFSAITPLHLCQILCTGRGGIERGILPLNYLVPHFLKAVLNLGNIDIFAPGLLAFTGGLFVLCGCFLYGRHIDCLVGGSKSQKSGLSVWVGSEIKVKSSKWEKFEMGKVRNFADTRATSCVTCLGFPHGLPQAVRRGAACSTPGVFSPEGTSTD